MHKRNFRLSASHSITDKLYAVTLSKTKLRSKSALTLVATSPHNIVRAKFYNAHCQPSPVVRTRNRIIKFFPYLKLERILLRIIEASSLFSPSIRYFESNLAEFSQVLGISSKYLSVLPDEILIDYEILIKTLRFFSKTKANFGILI